MKARNACCAEEQGSHDASIVFIARNRADRSTSRHEASDAEGQAQIPDDSPSSQ